MARYVFFSLIAVFFLFSCEENKTAEAYEQVMNLHDEVMAKNTELINLQGKLEEKISELNASTTPVDSMTLVNHHQSMEELKSANKMMMDWMHGFDKDVLKKGKEEAMTYLNEQKESMQKVADAYNESMSSAKKLLEE